MRALNHKISLTYLLLFLITPLHLLIAEEPTPKLEKVTISYLPVSNALPLFLAIEEGIFKKHGIEAEIIKFQAPNQIIDTLIAGRADAGGPGTASGITILASEKFPGSLKVAQLNGSLADEEVSSQVTLLAITKSSIKTFTDLKGKSLGILPGIQWRTFTKRILRKNGLNPEMDVKLVEVPVQQHITALLSGSVDATLSVEPTGTIAQASGQVTSLEKSIGTKYLADPFYPGATVLSGKFIENRPSVAKALVSALDEAIEIIRSSEDGKKYLLEKYLNMNKDHLKYLAIPEFVTSDELISRKKLVRNKLYDPVADYQKIADIFLEEDVLKNRVDVSGLIYNK
jgi:NitT/TauT family transport system substrate-binding protein